MSSRIILSKRSEIGGAGFTLIELLVTIAIIGILAAIAIPQYSSYKERAFNSRAQTDMRNVITAQEAFYVDNETYTDDAGLLPGYIGSDGVTTEVSHDEGEEAWSGLSYHSQGTHTYCFDTEDGSKIRNAEGLGEVGECSDTL